ncbi:MAG: non-homologous end-joining DNA ligase [Microlunatus sp.]|nr:non-homologous end-joining DNA ligase [Microlunatus sp.]MDN5771020.1 non-homologous end-joining DNA ligase [Microlunatus sp.]MDN5804066.1 non-homologous end-joining DNA ligase [Microlunatus sp.]
MAAAHSIRTRIAGRELSLVNLDKVLYPAVGYAKAEVISYYAQIADVLLPHVADRALTRVRFPDGVAGPSFYEKNAPAGTPDWVRTQRIETSDGPVAYVVADEPATVVWLANLAALELHVPQWRISALDRTTTVAGAVERGEPLVDRVVIDLDPGAGMSIIETARAALIAAERLAADGLVPVPQTSGNKGIQVYAAVAPTPARQVWSYVKRLNVTLHRHQPELFVSSMSIAERAGRIYVDYNQNLAARNTIAPYSLRGRERPNVATPLTWDEVAAAGSPDDLRFSPDEVLARVARHGDLAVDLLHPDRPRLPTPERLPG